MNARRLAITALTLAVLTVAAVVLWAFLWPHSGCSHPGCARQRFSLSVEVDSFRNVTSPPLEIETDERRVSARNILRSGGIDVEFVHDDTTLPYSPQSGPLDRADLYQYAQVWRNRAVPARVDGKVYAILTPALVSDTGERLFGIMFDQQGREGIAVSPGETVRAFSKREPQNIELLQLRTFVHELLHALNRTHLDAIQRRDGTLTLEAPTRCLASVQDGQWTLTTAPSMSLSPTTIQFFQTAHERDILPGVSNSPYDGLESSPTECADVRANRAGRIAAWHVALQRLRGLLPFTDATAAEGDDAAESLDSAEPQEQAGEEQIEDPVTSAVLRIQAQEAEYPLGYPIAIRIMVENTGTHPLPLKRRLAPGYGMIKIEYRTPRESEWRRLRPLEWYEPASDVRALLDPGKRHEQTVPIYFGEEGWTFSTPGEYAVRAILTTSEEDPEIVSEPIMVRVREPDTVSEQVVVSGLLNEQGMLDHELGRVLIFGARIGTRESRAPIEHLVSSHQDTALGSALQLTLASQRIAPAIDPLTGERAEPDFEEARGLLEESCTDSGIEALKHQLLRRHSKAPLRDIRRAALPSAEAWDGTTQTEDEAHIATYSDPALKRYGPSIHFCLNEASLRDRPLAAAHRVARELRRLEPTRIIVVGHADRQGRCALNDDLALSRARAVAEVLGRRLPGAMIHTVSLGERRPLDFGSSPHALQRNRRVEVLIDADVELDDAPPVDGVMPTCGVAGQEGEERDPVAEA